MSAAIYNLDGSDANHPSINAGADFSLDLIFQNGNGVAYSLTGYSFLAQIRPSYGSNIILASFTCTPDPGTTGRLVLSLTNAQTRSLSFSSGVYDLLVTNMSQVKTRYMQGTVILSPAASI